MNFNHFLVFNFFYITEKMNMYFDISIIAKWCPLHITLPLSMYVRRRVDTGAGVSSQRE
ncbi:hypothetical protein HanRHA438_Chr03g0097751 [Helianthus annuus]|nr:hypothetical protein HanRHA438_Chr03g0097751 [Helianthus annuus]